MEIKRFYAVFGAAPDTLIVEGEELYHLAKVLRYKPGYKAIACTGDGNEYMCVVKSVDKERAVLKAESVRKCEGDPTFDVTLFQSLPKAAKTEFIVQKAVELGAKRIVFFSSKYSADEKLNLRRAEKIAMEACKQCGRSAAIEISFEEGLDKVLDMCGGELTVMPYERAVSGDMHSAMRGSSGGVNVIIGSEGGFSEEEAELASSRGAKLISLGKRILRCETAALVALALVQYERGQLGA